MLNCSALALVLMFFRLECLVLWETGERLILPGLDNRRLELIWLIF